MNTPPTEHDTIRLKVSILEHPDQVLTLPRPTGQTSLQALEHLPRTEDGMYNLTTPLVNLRKFRASQVDLRMQPGLSSDQYIEHYLKEHHKVFEVLQRAEMTHLKTRRDLITTQIKMVVLAFLLLAGIYLADVTGLLAQAPNLLPTWEHRAALGIIVTALLLSPIYLLHNRLKTIERRFLNGHRGLTKIAPHS